MNPATTMNGDPYRRSFLRALPRLLSLQDRDPFSPTFGCFDRTYWQWKFTDFPGARFQEGVTALALLYANPIEGNPCCGNPAVLEWVRAGMAFWCKIQYTDGSFDEAYPWEHSFAATAFTSFYISEALLALGEKLAGEAAAPVIASLGRAGEWLIGNGEHHAVISNHLAAACAALCNIRALTGEERYITRAEELLEIIRDGQSDEGWFSEYGGPDVGYQSHTTFYLAKYHRRRPDDAVLEMLRRGADFARYFVHPNGTMGGEYCSRNTEFYSPGGYEIIASAVPAARAIADRMLGSVAAATVAGLEAMDAYNFMPLLTSCLTAYLEHSGGAESEPLPCDSNFERYFDHARIYVTRTDAYYAVLGLSKGGVIRVYDASTGALLGSDCGYLAVSDNGVQASSQYYDPGRDVRRENGRFEVVSPFVGVPRNIFTPGKFVLFRCFSCTLGRLPRVALWLKGALVKTLIRGRSRCNLTLRRTVTFGPDTIAIEDTVEKGGGITVKVLVRGDRYSTVHMGSSQYFQAQELAAGTAVETCDTGELNRAGTLALRREWTIPPKGR